MQREIPEGAVVRTTHYRRYANFETLATRREAELLALGAPLPKGGLTLVWIERPGLLGVSGSAICSEQENFSRRKGRTIALGRALKKQATS